MASPPARVISRATVVMVDWGELGFGGNGESLARSASAVVDLAATTTFQNGQVLLASWAASVGGTGIALLRTGVAFFGQVNGDLAADAP